MTDAERVERVRDLFDLASRLPDDLVESTLERVEGDASIRAEVMDLLAIDRDRSPQDRGLPASGVIALRSESLPRDHAVIRQAPASLVVLLPGMNIHDFELVEPIAAGGSADVWKARRHVDDGGGFVAIKVMRPEATGMHAAAIVERFERERRALGRVSHPGVVPLLGAGTLAGGHPYLVVGWFEGAPLGSEGPPSSLTVSLAGAALAAMHEAGVAHGDLKPANLLVASDGTVAIIELGDCCSLAERPDAAEADRRDLAAMLAAAGYVSDAALARGARRPWSVAARVGVGVGAGVAAVLLATAVMSLHARALRGASTRAALLAERVHQFDGPLASWTEALDDLDPTAETLVRIAHRALDFGAPERALAALDRVALDAQGVSDEALTIALAHAALRAGAPLRAERAIGTTHHGDRSPDTLEASPWRVERSALRAWSAWERGDESTAFALVPALRVAAAERGIPIAREALAVIERGEAIERAAAEGGASVRDDDALTLASPAIRCIELLAHLDGADPGDALAAARRRELLDLVRSLALTHGSLAPRRVGALVRLLDHARRADDAPVGVDAAAELVRCADAAPRSLRNERVTEALLAVVRARVAFGDRGGAVAALRQIDAAEPSLLVVAVRALIDPETPDGSSLRQTMAAAMRDRPPVRDAPSVALAEWLARSFEGIDGSGAEVDRLVEATCASLDVIDHPERPIAVRAVQALVATPADCAALIAPSAPVAEMAVEVVDRHFGPDSPPTSADFEFLIWLGQELIERCHFDELAVLTLTIGRIGTTEANDAAAILTAFAALPPDLRAAGPGDGHEDLSTAAIDAAFATVAERCSNGVIDEVSLRLVTRLASRVRAVRGTQDAQRWWDLVSRCRSPAP